jgi:hypothetical protein
MAKGKHGPWRWVKSTRMGTSTSCRGCGEKAWEAGEARQLGHVPFLLSLAADLFTRGGLCLTPLLGKSLAHYWPIMDPVTVNRAD